MYKILVKVSRSTFYCNAIDVTQKMRFLSYRVQDIVFYKIEDRCQQIFRTIPPTLSFNTCPFLWQFSLHIIVPILCVRVSILHRRWTSSTNKLISYNKFCVYLCNESALKQTRNSTSLLYWDGYSQYHNAKL